MKLKHVIVLVLLGLSIIGCAKSDKINQQPTCKIAFPSNGQSFEELNPVAISVAANDSDGIITFVLISIDGVKKSTLHSPPYDYTWNTDLVSTGSHSIIAVCIDNFGSTNSDEISIVIVQSATIPSAGFSANPTSGTAPLTVNFTDESSENPVSWLWDFGDGASSTIQNPTHIYNADGQYTVALTVVNSFGNDTETKVNYIVVGTVANLPVADFIANPLSGTVPLTVNFTDQSSNNPTSWQWDFGDGNSSTQQNPTHNYSSIGAFTVSLSVNNGNGSDSETKTNYIDVTNGSGTWQPCPGVPTVTDYDGNQYNTVLMGNQCWMKENLRTTHFSNGTSIPLVETNSAWNALALTWNEKGFCYYNNNLSNADTLGALYNWYAAMNGASSSNSNPSNVQGICPVGWHLPSDAEWEVIEDYLADNGSNYDGSTGGGGEKIAKSMASGVQWSNSTVAGAVGNDLSLNNSSGFNAYPSGERLNAGALFLGKGKVCYWWTATENNYDLSFYRQLTYSKANVDRDYNYKSAGGLSVRCVKD